MSCSSIKVCSASLILAALAGTACAQCPLTFNAFTTVSTGTAPLAMTSGDVNADGKLDLIFANSGSASISVCMGNGDGTFIAAVNYAVGTSPVCVAAGDLNGDGRLDLVVTNFSSSSMSVLLNNGNGTFATAVPYTCGNNPRQVAIADLNADGRLDLAVSNQGAGTVSILLNNGGGVFAPKVDYNPGTNPYGVGISDFNNDGVLDLAVSRGGAGGSGGVSILRGSGDGTFQAAANTGAGGGTFTQIADLNKDGLEDLVVLNQNAGAVFMQLGNSDGTFQAATSVVVGAGLATASQNVGIADIDGDGNLDFAVPVNGAATVRVYTGNGDGTFNSPLALTTGSDPTCVTVGDFNGDGSPDIATTNRTPNQGSVLISTTPIINYTAQPVNWSMIVGGNITMGVTVNGTAFQWYRNGVPLTNDGHFFGTSTPIMHILGILPSDAGFYHCVTTNGCASKPSNVALVSVYNPCPADFNGDGTVDFFDYLDFVDSYSVGC